MPICRLALWSRRWFKFICQRLFFGLDGQELKQAWEWVGGLASTCNVQWWKESLNVIFLFFLSLRSRSVGFRFKNGSLLPVVTRSESAIKGRGGGDVSLPIISIWLTSSLTLGLTCGFRRRQEAPYYRLLEFIILFSFFLPSRLAASVATSVLISKWIILS